ncbi:MAG: SDR family oxidoreductase [Pseudomonadota bacterium]
MVTDLDFSCSRVLVVGGSSGIGNGIAQAFRGRGAEVHVWGTRPSASHYDGGEGSDLKGLSYAQVDISEPAQIDAASDFEKLDVLVLCQGTVRYGRAEFERQGWDEVMEVNLNSVMFIAQKYRPVLSGGSVIIVSSVAGFNAARGNPAYAASKAGAVGLTKTLGEAWASEGIRVNGIAPGFVDTKLTKVTTENEKRLKATLASIPQGRLGQPSDMAGAALFLASPLASYMCGQTLIVDGGLTLS